MNNELIEMIISLRKAQIAFELKATRSNMMEKIKAENKIDIWISKHQKDIDQLEFFTRSDKSTESPGVYNVSNGEKS